MKQLANDEIKIPQEMFEDRIPTHNLRLRDVGYGRLLLEQLWVSPMQGIKDEWIPISCA